MKKILKRYSVFIILLVINIAVIIFFPTVGEKSIQLTWGNALEMLSILPPIFILLGLLDIWVKKETMIKIMGEKSKFIGILNCIFIGFCSCRSAVRRVSSSGYANEKGQQVF